MQNQNWKIMVMKLDNIFTDDDVNVQYDDTTRIEIYLFLMIAFLKVKQCTCYSLPTRLYMAKGLSIALSFLLGILHKDPYDHLEIFLKPT